MAAATRTSTERWAALRTRARTAGLPRVGGSGEQQTERDWRPLAIGVGAALLVVVVAKVVLPDGLPNEIILLGLVLGGLNALPALGIVLIYRSNRIVNFAQGELGAVAATLTYLLIVTLHWPWGVAVFLSLLTAVVVGGLVEFGIMRRFFSAPRLLVTMATIGVAQLLAGLRLGLPGVFPDVPGFAGGTFPSPFHGTAFQLGDAIYAWNHVLVMVIVPVAVVAVAAFLRRTWAGLGSRAAAENMDRSRLLGIPVRRLATIVWAVAALLSAMTALLKAPVAGFSLIASSGTPLMVRTLAPAAIGGFTSLPITLGAALVLGVVEQAFLWNWSRGGPTEAVLLVVLVAALLVRSIRSRAYETESTSWVTVREMARVPRRVLRLPDVRAGQWWLAVFAVQMLLVLPWLLSPDKTSLAGLIGIHVIVGLSLVVLTGWAGQVSLGHWAIVGVGAFVAGNAATRWELDFFVTLVLGVLAGGVASLVLGLPAQRLPGIMFGVTTLGFALAAEQYLFELDWVAVTDRIHRPELFGAVALDSHDAFYYVVAAGVVVALLAVWNLKRYRLADVLLASRDNPRAAEAFGVSVTTARRIAFFLSGSLAGLAGVLYAFHQQVAESSRFPADLGLSVLAMVVIGGLGSISGVVLGAVFVRMTQYLLPGWAHFFASGMGLLIVMLIFPGGLGEAVFRVRNRLLLWVGRGRVVEDRRDEIGEDAGVAA